MLIGSQHLARNEHSSWQLCSGALFWRTTRPTEARTLEETPNARGRQTLSLLQYTFSLPEGHLVEMKHVSYARVNLSGDHATKRQHEGQ